MVKKIQMAILVAFTAIFSACTGQTTTPTGVVNLTPSEFSEIIKEGGIVLDVRTPGEVEDGHIPSMINIDYYGNDFESNVSTLDKDAAICVYCRSGKRSASSATILHKQGFTKVYNLLGGFNAWKSSGLPIVK
ncbi:MAG TPA: rhodanese-like domain-containing protein [Flavobacteriales bacterium]|nr:rhodanese-like domain-containing protein [Flavobacteriales bacterium]HIB76618.1 rhodanese-like domain-containing protein [Flavobacteriales bacterium]HIN41710.1 rhodanese-like domain-containing protein [Flavobacteriales bacterium]HIO16682.1 rhodanese-like domain-containing protein [Flavobacteriales bacterium]